MRNIKAKLQKVPRECNIYDYASEWVLIDIIISHTLFSLNTGVAIN